MDKLDAVFLQNFFPGTNSVVKRAGYSNYATGITGQVETLMAYTSGTASKLFAVNAAGDLYNVSVAGAVGSPEVSGFQNGRFQYVNFTTTGGSYLCMVNGQDAYSVYDGTSWHADGDGSPYDISNVSTATIESLTVFKKRIWMIQTGTLKAWYLPINSIGGAATALDMSSLPSMGGYLVAAMTWTIDGGEGLDDHLVFITSKGEALVWKLTDPTTPTGISLIGVFSLGSPVGRRCWVKYAGDLLIITQDGVVPMSGALQSSRTNPRVSITDKIQSAMGDAISQYSANFGWQLLVFPKQGQLYLNVPVGEGYSQQQYVQNNITRNWCNFTGWEANCWELFNDDAYFGGDGFVGKAWDGTTDNGASIIGVALQAFHDYGTASQKQCKMIRYHLRTDGTPAIFGDVNVDYDTQDVSAQLSTVASDFGEWDAGDWDGAIWGAGMVPTAIWQGATGIGYTFAPFLKTATNGEQLLWTATDIQFEVGGTL